MVKEHPAFQPHKRKASQGKGWAEASTMRCTELVIPAFFSKGPMFESVFNRTVRLLIE